MLARFREAGNAVLFGVDTMMNLCVVYLLIGPSGAAFSMDQWLRRYWATRRAAREGLPAPVFGPPSHQVSANFALRLLQINVCLVYFISGLSKMQGASWLNGTAVWGVMANYEFSPMRAPLYLLVLRIMCEHRWLWELVITSLTFFTLAFEISFIYLIWSRRMRWTMIVAAVLMHLGIAVCMGLVTFSMMTLVLVLSFVPAPAIRQLLERFAPRAGTLAFDSAQTNGHSLKPSSGTAGSFRASTRV